MANESFGFPTPIIPGRTRVGWIGAGVMGSAMATHLLAAGYSLTVHTRTPSKSTPLLHLGAQFAPTAAAAAAASDVLFTMVGHPSDVRSVILHPTTGALASLAPNSVLVDCTSSHPALAREIAAAARDRGCWAVDAPVSGGDLGAREGKLAIFAGGDEAVIEWLRPVMEVMGRTMRMGPPGSGQSSKIANQIVVAANLVGLSEAVLFAEKVGLEKKGFVEAVRGGAGETKAMELFGEKMVNKEWEAGGMVEYMVKDLGMALEAPATAAEEVVVLPGAAVNRGLFMGMVANGDGKLGIQGVIGVLERMNSMGG